MGLQISLWYRFYLYLKVDLLDHLLFCSILAVPIYIPSNGAPEFFFLHTLVICQRLLFAIFPMTVLWTDVKWYLIVVLIHISLKISYVEHLFMCL